MSIRDMLRPGRNEGNSIDREARRAQYQREYTIALFKGLAAFLAVYIPFNVILFLIKRFL